MTDKDLGTAAGDIFAKAFTLGYETGRKYVPAGGMALTAEQVEDVRIVLGLNGSQDIKVVLDAQARLRALFPATEPAEVSGNIFAEGNSSPTVVHVHHHDIEAHAASFNEGYEEAVRQFTDPAPAEPAEEETKAETRMDATDLALTETRAEVAGAVAKYPPFNSSHEGYAVLKEEVDELWDDVKANNVEHSIEEAVQVAAMAIRYITDMRAASSPVVPAPTETGPWQRIEDVPESVYLIKDCEGDKWRRDRKSWEVYSERGFRWHPGFPDRFAPFVAAEEG